MRENTEERITSNLSNLSLIKIIMPKFKSKRHKMTNFQMNVTMNMMKDD